MKFPEPPSPFGPSEAARRVSDVINLHVMALPASTLITPGRWVAVRLADGHSNGTAYDSRYGAVLDHHNLAMGYAYPRVPIDGCTPRMAESLLKMWRLAYEAGHRLDPDELRGGSLILLDPHGRVI